MSSKQRIADALSELENFKQQLRMSTIEDDLLILREEGIRKDKYFPDTNASSTSRTRDNFKKANTVENKNIESNKQQLQQWHQPGKSTPSVQPLTMRHPNIPQNASMPLKPSLKKASGYAADETRGTVISHSSTITSKKTEDVMANDDDDISSLGSKVLIHLRRCSRISYPSPVSHLLI